MITVRPARLPDDKPDILRFIDGLQAYEAEFESDRRLDAAYAEDQYAALVKQTENGGFLIAEKDGAAIGWAAIHEYESPVYVVPAARRSAMICELYVDAAARGQGAGRALLAACEEWTRARGLRTLYIGHLSQNRLAPMAYERSGFEPYVLLRRKKLV